MNHCIKVVYITDEGYAMPTCVSISSLISNLDESDEVKIYVICGMLSELAKERFGLLRSSRVHIELVEVQNEENIKLAKINIREDYTYVTGTALFKFRLSEILQQEDKVVYLDSDILVQKSLRTLYDYRVEDCYVAAVNDMLGIDDAGYPVLAKRIGLDCEDYFNSGVMLLNLKKMRMDGVSEKLLEYRKNGINYFMDQDALNAILGCKRVKLPYIYNFMSTVTDFYGVDKISDKFFAQPQESIEGCIDAAVILHLTGTRKPWKYCMPWYSAIFLKYYEKSPYRTEKLYLESPIKELNDRFYGMQRNYESKINHLINTSEKKDFVVPYNRIERGCRLVLYGGGNVGKSYYNQLILTQYCNVVLWVDRMGRQAGKNVSDISLISKIEYDYILIAVKAREMALEIEHSLMVDFQVNKENILHIEERG